MVQFCIQVCVQGIYKDMTYSRKSQYNNILMENKNVRNCNLRIEKGKPIPITLNVN